MAEPRKSAVPVLLGRAMSPEPQSVAGLPPGLPLLRFSLRHLLLFVAALSALLAGIASLNGISALAVLLAAVVVTFHLFGTALGSQLRRHANGIRDRPTSSGSSVDKSPDQGAQLDDLSPIPSPFYGRCGASFAWLPRLVTAAVLFGGCLGALFLTSTIGERASFAALAVGGISIAVLTGWFAFLAGSFYAIVRHGFNEAIAEQRPGKSRRN